jgi:PKD repeat protein
MFLIMGCVGAVSADGELKINSFSADPLKVNVNSPVTFTFDVENYTTISIAFGDGGNPYTPTESGSITHPYSTAKTYTATLTATNATTSVTLSRYIEVTEPVIPLAASFTTDKSSGVAPLTVQFTNTSTGSPSSYIWTFGSAGTSTEKDPTYTFTTPGEYDVVLNISDGTTYSECTKTITITPRVITNVVIFGLTAPESGESPDYSASVSSTPNGNVNSAPVISWQFASNGTTVTGNFANGTIYKAIVTIEATNDYNFTTSTGFEVDDFSTSSVSHVLESNNRFVNVTCTYPATDAGTRDISSVSITGVTLPVGGATKNTTKPAVSSNPSGSVDTISSITWKNWSDGSTNGTVFKYETVYQAIMTVEAKSGYRFTSGSAATLNGNDAYLVPDTDGTSATITYTCTKTATEGKILPAITTFSVTPTSGTSPLTVRFTVVTTNATTVTLNFGDGSTPSSTMNGYVDHTYSTAGTHYAILTATNTNSSVTQTRSILVNTPVATSTPTPTQTVAPTTASLTTLSIGEVVIPAPLDIIKEFMHLFYSLFDSTNYVFIVNES